MKHASKHKKPNPPSSKPAPLPRTGESKKHWVVLGLSLLLAAGSTWVIMEFVVWNRLPSELVGKWVVQDGEQEGATFDFYRNGTMIGVVNNRGQAEIINADVTIEGDTLFMTTYHPSTKEAMTTKHTIKTLTASRLVLQDERRNVYRMERALP
jgi:uncharacterized protein (TIGR03066 family)